MREALRQQQDNQWARMESVQPNYNLCERCIEAELLPLCAEQEIGVISYSPLGAGFLTGKYRQGVPMPAGTRFDIKPAHQSIYFTPEKWRIVEELRAHSEQTGLSMAHLALAWVIGRPGITSVLIGARTRNRLTKLFPPKRWAFLTRCALPLVPYRLDNGFKCACRGNRRRVEPDVVQFAHTADPIDGMPRIQAARSIGT